MLGSGLGWSVGVKGSKGSDVKLYKKGNQNCQGRVWSSSKNINSQSEPRGDILFFVSGAVVGPVPGS